jgi:hypothetical protein
MDYETILNTVSEEPEHMYKTARGSAYAHYKDNSTVRNRSGKDHKDKTEGLQTRSGRTVYMHPDDVNKMSGLYQNPELSTAFKPASYDKETKKGKVALTHTEDYGPKKAGTVIHEAPFTTKPAVGLAPVEVYRSESPKGDSGKGVHWGSKITEVRGMGGGSREMQLGADLDPKTMMQKYAKGGAVKMPQEYSAGSWKLI